MMPAAHGMRPPQGIAFNALQQFGSTGLLMALSLFSAPYVVHHLGPEWYGFLVLVGLTTSNMAMIDLGLGEAAVKFLAEEHAAGNGPGLRRVFWTSLWAYLGLGLAGAAGVLLLAPWLLRVLHVPPDMRLVALQVFRISAAGLVLSMLAGAVAAVPRALERFDVVSRVNALVGSGQLVLSMALLYLGFSIRGLVAGSAVLQAAALLAYALAARHLVPALGRPSWHSPTLRRMWRFGSLITLSQAGAAALAHAEKFMMSSLLTVAVVAYYAIPYNVVTAAGRIPWTLCVVLFPAFARLHAGGHHGRVTELYLRSTRYVMLLAFPLGLLLCIASRPFLTAWMGPEIAAHSAVVLSLLAIAFIIDSLATPALHAIRAGGRPELPAQYLLLQLVVHLPICFLLIRHFGIVGGAAAWLLRVVLNTALLTLSIARLMQLNPRVLLRRTLLRTAGVSLALAPLPAWLLPRLPPMPRVAMFGALAAVGSVYVLASVALALDAPDRSYLRAVVGRWRRPPALAVAAAPLLLSNP